MGAVNLPKGTPSRPFASAALELAEAGLAVIPCGSDDGKTPSIKWRNMRYHPGAALIGKLAKQHGHANVGILTGKLSGVLIVDIDDAEIVDPMLERFGRTPILMRTPSGGVHLWYRWNGEKSGGLRNQGLAVDIKGAGGIVVVPPSVRPSTGRPYTWLKGSLKDLSSLPRARPGSLPLTNERAAPEPLRAITKGQRNITLFKLLMREVRHCDSPVALQDVAETINDDCEPPLSDMELARLVNSVWSYETTGRNWAGKEAMIVFTASKFRILMDNPNALTLRGVLQVMHGARPGPFAIVAKAMAETGVIPGWGWRRYRSATNWLVNKGCLSVLHEGGKFPGDAWLFTLSSPPRAKGTPSGPNI